MRSPCPLPVPFWVKLCSTAPSARGWSQLPGPWARLARFSPLQVTPGLAKATGPDSALNGAASKWGRVPAPPTASD